MFGTIGTIFLSAALLAVAYGVSTEEESSFFSADTLDFNNWTRTLRVLKEEKERKPIVSPCIPMKNCSIDLDCNGGKCFGIAVGTCNCAACLQFTPCKSDADCGGLRGACSNQKYCDCDKGFKCAGLKGIFDALFKICNRKECIPNSTSCFGLPCNTGICSCPTQP
ncbi:Uncharacterized protein BM_BM5250 [Brugia malayi]|uniref:Bm5250 n=1 Tax=Brugia malayi TaxID=6279 RepID=A0A0K0JI47_BRUMA|nr:Uncharacterized protein BM_BM5250 [Brugia malayi]CDP95268.1 Bm5250 [Brugia malayi]VIO92171.1 Uncharacterized protein BM_BM5250 [Brugia malayi]